MSIYNTYPFTITVPPEAVKFKVVVHGKELVDLPDVKIQMEVGNKPTTFSKSPNDYEVPVIPTIPEDIVTASADTYSSTPKALSIVTLTQAEYDAIVTKNANTFYTIV